MGSANLSVNELVGADVKSTEMTTSTIHPSTTINNLKVDAGFSGTYVFPVDGAISGTILNTSSPAPTFAENVVQFNRVVLNIGRRPIDTLVQAEYDISCKCLKEEIEEFQQAFESGDIIGMIDALTDLKYFADGVLYKMGLPAKAIDMIGQAVHDANMSKKLGVNAKRGDGSAADATKPDGWVVPEERIAKIIDGLES